MSVLDEARAWLEKMKDHTDCCGTPIVRKLAAECERLERADDDRCCQWAAGIAEGVKLRRNTHTNPEVYALGWERGVNAVTRTFRALALR